MTTNRMTNLGSQTPTYDPMGNTTFDTYHHYAWDSEFRLIALDTIGLTNDAMGRLVEQNRSGIYTQVVYSPLGSKLALMNGQALAKAFVPLPAGATAVYGSSGLSYYRHSDWLGSSRLASTPSRTVYYDSAYAPFGEAYAESGTTDHRFAGTNMDTGVDLYDALYREYHPIQGRWISPDPAGLAVVDRENPQSWNRYPYVFSDPLVYVDPSGLQCSLYDRMFGCPTCKSECKGLGEQARGGCMVANIGTAMGSGVTAAEDAAVALGTGAAGLTGLSAASAAAHGAEALHAAKEIFGCGDAEEAGYTACMASRCNGSNQPCGCYYEQRREGLPPQQRHNPLIGGSGSPGSEFGLMAVWVPGVTLSVPGFWGYFGETGDTWSQTWFYTPGFWVWIKAARL